ncbi:hypothetical protein ABLV54_19915 [Klebsiella sp. JB_Kp042]|uniref:hypothetical protein n=1 Tax=Klebsiella TaxID=570 RepID=UPI00200E58D6|nr:hypothetical protein [Klebsiella quasipneumoniae]MCL1442298.1 hypothetical protein [Klebsiella quasipneumoniae]HBQ8755647.1 hypothetical protein [Klebsiella quasipneumoniae]HBS5600642.1 hypothetical protein [Klebsiella quasipneumoniae subsp. quasipneumoniae]
MMMELTFYNKNKEPDVVSVSDDCYEKLARIGFSTKIEYHEEPFIIEGEEYTVLFSKLTSKNRKILLSLVESERQEELEKIFKNINDNPTIKEMRDSLLYVRELTEVYKLLKAENNMYFSFD